jgi:hypothetical protein
VEHHAARQLLDDLDRAKADTRLRLAAFWFPLCLFGAIMLVAAGVGLRFGPAALGWSLLLGTPLGSVVVTAFYRRRALRIGLTRRHWPYLATAAVGVVASTGASAIVPARPCDAAPWLAVVPVYLVFARLERNLALAVLAGLIGLTIALFWAAAPTAPCGTLTGAGGAILLTAGLLLHRQEHP